MDPNQAPDRQGGDAQTLTIPIAFISERMPHAGLWALFQEDLHVVMEDDVPVRGSTIITVKNHHCVGHFPSYPIFPAALQYEFAAQTLGITGFGPQLLAQGVNGTFEVRFGGAGKTRHRLPTFPKDVIIVTMTIKRLRKTLVIGDVVMKRGDDVIATFQNVSATVVLAGE